MTVGLFGHRVATRIGTCLISVGTQFVGSYGHDKRAIPATRNRCYEILCGVGDFFSRR
jgi:hypothetical protein